MSSTFGVKDTLVDDGKSPLENVYDEELSAQVETELKALNEPYRTTVILRDIEELSYEQIAEVMQTSLGTVKSRLVRGREALRNVWRRICRRSVWTMGMRANRAPRRQPVGHKLRSYHDVLGCEGAYVVLPGWRGDAPPDGPDETNTLRACAECARPL